MTPLRRMLAHYLAPHKAQVALLLALMLIEAAALLALPRLIAQFVDGALTFDTRGLISIALGYLALAAISQLCAALASYMATSIGMRATNTLRADMLRHTLTLDMGWHNATTPGALIERIDGDATRLNALLSTMLPQLVVNITLMLGVLGALALIDWRAGVLAALAVPLTYWSIQKLRPASERRYAREREASAALFGLIEERLAGADDVRANGAADYVMRRFFSASRNWRSAVLPAMILGNSTWIVPATIFSILVVLVLVVGVSRFAGGAMTLGTLVAMYRYTDVLWRPINNLGRQIGEFLEGSASAVRLEALAALRPAVADSGRAELPAGPLTLALNDLSFAYADGDPVLQDISLILAPGRVLGLLGRTGSGKTTLTRLVARMYESPPDTITLNGLALPEVRAASLRARVTLVTQDVQLFSASVRDNLTLYDGGIAEPRIWQALEHVGLQTWARALPRGLDTPLTTGGNALSAGEAQLLAFARAFLRDPGLVILDEASSRLDPATEQQLEEAVDALLAGRSAIVIAHRLKTVERADDILVLEDGRIAEFGPRESLAADPASRYYALLNYGAEEMLA